MALAVIDFLSHSSVRVSFRCARAISAIGAEGFLYIVDRKKDMILSDGQNIYPKDIEAIIAVHDDVPDVAVIGRTCDIRIKSTTILHATLILLIAGKAMIWV